MPAAERLVLAAECLSLAAERVTRAAARVTLAAQRLILATARLVLAGARLIRAAERLIRAAERLIRAGARLVLAAERLVLAAERRPRPLVDHGSPIPAELALLVRAFRQQRPRAMVSGMADAVEKRAAVPDEEEFLEGANRAVRKAIEEARRSGITTVHAVEGRLVRVHPDGRREDLGPMQAP